MASEKAEKEKERVAKLRAGLKNASGDIVVNHCGKDESLNKLGPNRCNASN